MEQLLENKKDVNFNTGIDILGRIHIPIQLRKALKIKTGNRLYIYRSGINIILEKSNINIEKVYVARKMINNDMKIYTEIYRIKDSVLENKKRKLRVVDELGNCVIPIEIRKDLQIFENDTFKICTKDNKIILIKNSK